MAPASSFLVAGAASSYPPGLVDLGHGGGQNGGMKKFYACTLAASFALVFSACSASSEQEVAQSSASETALSLPTLVPYEPVADEELAIAELSEQELAQYREVLCSGSHFADPADLTSVSDMTDEEKIASVQEVNEAPAVVRQISDRNKTVTGDGNGALAKPGPAYCNQ